MVSIARILIILGLVLLVIGGLVYLSARLNLPLGRLPGDFRIDRGNFHFYFPLMTGLLLSVILTIVFNIIIRLIGKK